MNLLPQEYKADIKYEAWRRYIVSVGLSAALIGVVANALLLPSFLFLSFQIEQSQKELKDLQKGITYKKVKAGTERVKEMNKDINNMVEFDKGKIRVIPLMDDMFKRVPDGIILSEFSVNAEDTTINFSGKANLREVLREYIADMKLLPYAINVASSGYNPRQQTDVSFSMTIDFDNEKAP